MYTSIEIDRFRGIDHLRVDELRGLNLVVGKNNSGKTTLLEALFLLGDAPNAGKLATLAQLRGQAIDARSIESVWRPYFYQLKASTPITLHGSWQGDDMPRTLTVHGAPPSSVDATTTTTQPPNPYGLSVPLAPVMQSVFMEYRTGRAGQAFCSDARFDPSSGQVKVVVPTMRTDAAPTTLLSARTFPGPQHNAARLSAIIVQKQEGRITEALRLLDERIRRLAIVSDAGGPAVYVDVGLDSLMPLAVCGEGMARLFSIVVELLSIPGGVLLVDEIDNGLHHSVMADLWRALGALCEQNRVQVFATTHNDELLFSALEACEDSPGQLGLFRIDRMDGRHSVASYDPEAQRAVRELHFEVRG
jgi:hypothetical protein